MVDMVIFVIDIVMVIIVINVIIVNLLRIIIRSILGVKTNWFQNENIKCWLNQVIWGIAYSNKKT
jgi:hypothetical protein